jgi:hypothetical protein
MIPPFLLFPRVRFAYQPKYVTVCSPRSGMCVTSRAMSCDGVILSVASELS